MTDTADPNIAPTGSSTAAATPISLWPPSLRRLWLTISEFPLTAFVLLATSMGLLATLRYFGEIGYPIPDVASLLATAGLVAASAMVVALSLAVSLWAPLLILQMGDGTRPRWIDIAWAQIIPATLFLEWAFLAPSWNNLGAPWNWAVVIFTLLVLAVFLLWLDVWERMKATPLRDRFKYAWVFCMCALSAAALAQGVILLIQVTGGASLLTANQRGLVLLVLFYAAVLLISVLSKVKPGTAFFVVLSTVSVLLFAGSVWTAELPKMLATKAGIRINGTAELIVSKETCTRAQMLAKTVAQKHKQEWNGRECAEGGALLRAEVLVHSGGRWLILPRALDEVEMPSAIGRFTAPDAAIELVLPMREKLVP
ncbi:hypothetical protein EJP67_33245 [Variovorax guangxiensis]|uniref:DUF4153 domain-containing protein n=1 Tax=Variovorax guangxiensis TaxID=1775474 RepID=A0A3S0XXG7_9BURK|nr:hypothetical protein [Variovorax guangxiensis]RUR71924.1 hypothetical protein EJP67_33245 [Variovorax guangxiensis]